MVDVFVRTTFSKKGLMKFGMISVIFISLLFCFFTLQILLINVNAEAVANNTINQTAAIAPLNNIQLNFSVYSNVTGTGWRGNLTNVTIVFQPITGNTTLLNVSAGTVNTSASYVVTQPAGNTTTLIFSNTSTSTDLFTAMGQQLSFSVNVTAPSSGNYSIYINTTYNSTQLGNSTIVSLNVVVNGTNPVDIYLDNGTAYKNQNITITYGTQTTANVTALYSSSGTANLYEDFLAVSNNLTKTLAPGIHSYIGNITGNANYSSNATGLTYYVIVRPVINNTTPFNSSFIKGTSTQLFQTYVYDSNMSSTINVSYRNSTMSGWANSSLNCFNLTTANSSFLCNGTVNLSSYTEDSVQFYFVGLDTEGYAGYNGTAGTPFNFTIDRTVPVFTNFSITVGNGSSIVNGTTIRRWTTFSMKFNWTDNMQLSYWANITNITGSRVDRNTTFSTGNWTNVTYNPYEIASGTPFYVILAANDSAGNENRTYYEWSINNVCGDGYCDIGEVCSNCASDCGTCTITTTPGSGSTTITTTEGFTKIILSASPTEPAIVTIGSDKANELKVDEVKVELKDSVSNVQLSVKESSIPSGANFAVSTEEGATYKYIEITTTIPSTKIDQVTISFKVEKSWLSANGLDYTTVTLQRYADNKWTKLTTILVDQDSTYYYFEAISPGFSIFAITGEKQSAEGQPTEKCPTCSDCSVWSDCTSNKQTRTCYKCDAATEYKCQSYTETRDCSPFVEEVKKTSWVVLVAWGVAVVGLIVIVLLLTRKKKPAHRD